MKNSTRWSGLGSCGLLLVALVAGCGGGSGAAPVPFATLANQLADAWCDNIGGCCQAASIAFNVASCKQAVLATLNPGLAQENNQNIHYDSAAAGRCVAAYGSTAQSCKDDGSVDTACQGVFSGVLPAGAACTISDECASPTNADAYCAGGDSTNASAQGVCTVETFAGVHGKLGQACQGSCGADGDCTSNGQAGTVPVTMTTSCFTADGLQCDAATQTCQALIVLGRACSGEDCVAGAVCINGACSMPQADGAVCAGDSECASGACVYGANPLATGTCGQRSLANQQTCSGDLQ